MSLGAALLLLAQLASAGGAAGEASRPVDTGGAGAGASRAPVATASARATARIVRPVSVRIERRGEQVTVETQGHQKPQQERDEDGMLWIEFS